MAAIPRPDPHQRATLTAAPGEAASLAQLPTGCRFSPRCPFAIDLCRAADPPMQVVGPDHVSACHRVAELPQFDAVPHRPIAPAAARRLALYAGLRETVGAAS